MTITFPQAPLRSRTVGFPESGSDLGMSAQGLPEHGGNSNAGAYTPPPPRFTTEPRPNNGIADLGSKSEATHGPPSAQSPFARWRCYRQRRDVQRRVSGHYPAFLAPTGSCARPNPSHRLRSRPWSMGLCRLSPAPAGRWPFPTLSPPVFPQVPGPLPRRSTWCTCPFLPMWHRPSPCCERVGSPR
jgi:hypothetical protein